MLAKKKKKAEKARRRFKKEKEISWWVQAGESWSDVEVELESEEPIEMGGDASASKEEGDRSGVVTSAEHREPMVASVDSGRDTKTRGDVPESRKHAASEDTAVKREAPNVVEHAGRSGGRDRSCGGYDPGYPRQITWAMPPEAAQPTRRSLAGHDSAQRLPQNTKKIS